MLSYVWYKRRYAENNNVLLVIYLRTQRKVGIYENLSKRQIWSIFTPIRKKMNILQTPKMAKTTAVVSTCQISLFHRMSFPDFVPYFNSNVLCRL